MAPVRSFLAAAVTAVAVGAFPSRTFEERVAAGECAGPNANTSDLFRHIQAPFSLPSPAVAALEPLPADATAEDREWGWELAYGPGFKVLHEPRRPYGAAYFVLVQCGAKVPGEEELAKVVRHVRSRHGEKRYFDVPLQAAAALRWDEGFFEVLGVQDRLAYVAETVAGACTGKASWCSPGATAWNQDYLNQEVPAFQGNRLFPAPLRDAEVVKAYASFFNKEREATDFFDKLLEAYSKHRSAPRLKVACVFASGDYMGVRLDGRESWKLKAANLEHVDIKKVMDRVKGPGKLSGWYGHTGGDENMAVRHEGDGRALFDSLEAEGVEAVLDILPANDFKGLEPDTGMASFFTRYHLPTDANYTFLRSKLLLRANGLQSAHGKRPDRSDLLNFGHGQARPDLWVEGLSRALGRGGELRAYYWLNVARGERATHLDNSSCAAAMPLCDGAARPKAIGLGGGEGGLYAAFDRGYPAQVPVPLASLTVLLNTSRLLGKKVFAGLQEGCRDFAESVLGEGKAGCIVEVSVTAEASITLGSEVAGDGLALLLKAVGATAGGGAWRALRSKVIANGAEYRANASLGRRSGRLGAPLNLTVREERVIVKEEDLEGAQPMGDAASFNAALARKVAELAASSGVDASGVAGHVDLVSEEASAEMTIVARASDAPADLGTAMFAEVAARSGQVDLFLRSSLKVDSCPGRRCGGHGRCSPGANCKESPLPSTSGPGLQVDVKPAAEVESLSVRSDPPAALLIAAALLVLL